MAKAHIQEYRSLGNDISGQVVPVGMEPAASSQTVTYTTASQSAAFNGGTHFVRIITDADAFLSFGLNPTATADSMFLPANTSEYWGVVDGQKVSIYDGTS